MTRLDQQHFQTRQQRFRAIEAPSLSRGHIFQNEAATFSAIKTTDQKSHARDLPPRHLSIAAVFEHAWEMLTPQQQALLAGLSVFAGDFDLEAAEAVAGAEPVLLQALVDKSLLSSGGNGRFHLHELLCHFAALKLAAEPGREQRMRRRHSAFYTGVLSDIENACKHDVRQVAPSLVRISNLYNNALSAWQFAVDHLLLQEISASIYALSLFFEFQSLFTIGKELLEEVLHRFETAGLPVPAGVRMRLLSHYGWLCQDTDEGALALRSFAEAYVIAQEPGTKCDDDWCLLLFFYGWTLHFHGRSQQGLTYLRQGQQLAQEIENEFGFVLCTLARGDVYCDLGEYARTREMIALLPYDIGPFLQVLTQGQLAITDAADGDYESAAAIIREMIGLLYELPFVSSMFYIVTCIAALCGYQGNYETAVMILSAQMQQERLGGFAERRTCFLLEEFQPHLAPADSRSIQQRSAGGPILAPPPPADFGFNGQTLTYLNDLLASVTALAN